MNFFDPLLGFAVLTGPLWLILILLPVCIWIAVKISRWFKPGIARITGGAGIFFLLFALPFGDEIVGRIYLSYLCSAEAGAKVYKTVELPAEFWDKQGRPIFLKSNGDLDKTILGERFKEPHLIEHHSTFFKLDRRRMQLVDQDSQEMLGEVIDFMYWGGWISRNLSPNHNAADCREVYDPIFASSFYAKFFKPVNSP